MPVTRTLPEGAVVHDSLEDFLASPRRRDSAVHSILLDGRPLDVKFEDRGHDATLVSFHAAMKPSKLTLPVFTGAGVSEKLPVNRLFVCDPSLYLHTGLTLGWFAGNSGQPRLQQAISAIIGALVTAPERTILFGASGGGFAAMHYATSLPGSLAVPINPQTSLARYNPAVLERYLKVAWQGRKLDELGITHDLVQVYAAGADNAVRYVQNTGDASHMEEHHDPFMAALPAGHQVEQVLVDVGEGHVAPPRPMMTRLLAEAVEDHLGS